MFQYTNQNIPQGQGQDLAPWGETTVVGKPIPRIDAHERLSGAAVYTMDVHLPGMLHAAIVRSPYANARVKRIETRKAESTPGVKAVVSVAEANLRKILVPYGWWINDGVPMRLFDEHCRFVGQEVAALAADTPEHAEEAARAVEVEYEQLPFVLGVDEALKPGAPPIHETGNLVRTNDVYQRGDMENGFAAADVVLQEVYDTSCLIHAPMETHVSVANWEGRNHLTVWDSTQGVFPHQQYLAQALGLPLSAVRVVCKYMGGGFGSKKELSHHTIIAALLARKAGRPVKLAVTREDAFLCTGNRPAGAITMKGGVKKDGTLMALQFTTKGTVGAYTESASDALQVADLYTCPNVRVEETEAFTNTGRARGMRGPGFPQCSWALEQMMDALAAKIGMDPVEFRLKNIPVVSQLRRQQPYSTSGLKQCLAEGAAAFGWDQARKRARTTGPIKRGVGMAACMWGFPAMPPATAVVKLFVDGSVNLNIGTTDIGTGTNTVMAMVVAEELDVPLERIQVESSDTATTQFAQTSGGSGTVVRNAPAVRAAAAEVKRQLLELASAELNRPVSELILRKERIEVANEPTKGLRVADLRVLKAQRVIVGVGYRRPNPPGKLSLPFAANFAEVEVNTNTGEVKVLRLLAAHDSGRVMNRLTYENQVFGGMAMGAGFALTERRVVDRQTGKVLTTNWHDYKMPTAMDVPFDQSCLPIDSHDLGSNNVAAKGLGEPATIATAPAVANAIFNATGVRVTRAPMSPMEMLRALHREGSAGL